MGRVMFILAAAFFLSGCGKEGWKESKVMFDGEYQLENADNMTFTFSEDSTLTIVQNGIYELGETDEGEPVVRICLDDITRELPEDYNFTEYLLKEVDGHIVLTYTTEEFSLDANPMALFLLDGEDGLLSGEYFEGTYQIGDDGDSYQYFFREDGSVTMQVRERYYAERGEITLYDHAGKTRYLYEETEDSLVLKNRKQEPALILVKEQEAE